MKGSYMMGVGVTWAEARPCRCQCWGGRSGGVQWRLQRLAGERERSSGVNNEGEIKKIKGIFSWDASAHLGYVDNKLDFDEAGGSLG